MKLKNLPFLAPVLALGVMVAPGSAFGQDSRSDVEMWAQTCSNCHSNMPRTGYTPDKWGAIITHMTINARLTDQQAEAILRYILRANRSREQEQAQATAPVATTPEKAKPKAAPDKDPPKSGGAGG